MGFVETADLRIYVEQKGEGAPVLFISGTGGDLVGRRNPLAPLRWLTTVMTPLVAMTVLHHRRTRKNCMPASVILNCADSKAGTFF